MKPVLGLTFTPIGEIELARTIVDTRVPSGEGPRVVATANLDHIVNISKNDAFRRAYRRAWAVTADGMPVFLYARLRGLLLPGRVTGADLCRRLLGDLSPERHRLFLIVSSVETADRIRTILFKRGFSPKALEFRVPPFGFDEDDAYSEDFAARIRRHGTTHLFLGVGAPKSEIWTDRFRAKLGDCYVLNVGAGLDFFAGTKPRAPRLLRQTGLEWAWRLLTEPRRLFRRYVVNSWRFLRVVQADLAGKSI